MPVASEAMLPRQPACTQSRSCLHPAPLTSFHLGRVLEAAGARGALLVHMGRRAWVKKTVVRGDLSGCDLHPEQQRRAGYEGHPGRHSWEAAACSMLGVGDGAEAAPP